MSILHPIILAGGSGSRLWPLSRELNPKQFQVLVDNSHSMLQTTIKRLEGLDFSGITLICNENHRFLAAEQLRQLGMDNANILLEPVGRNTAPAIALAALKAKAEFEDPILLALAADHFIKDISSFRSRIKSALPLAQSGKLVTFGVVPTHPETGYGYIKKGSDTGGGSFKVNGFIEKPNLASAQEYLTNGSYLWNSGIFMFRASLYLEELEKHQPSMLRTCQKAVLEIDHDMYFNRIKEEIFSACPEGSIDNIVMEKTDKAVVIPMNTGWSDIGSWPALWDVEEKDTNGNVIKGDVISKNSHDNYIHSNYRLVATVGIDNIIIVETKDAILVAHNTQTQHVKEIFNQLKTNHRQEHLDHSVVYRPWGKYDLIDKGSRHQVKRITVNPGAKLSTQMHHHRSEHWVVVSGTAKVTNGDKIYLVSENQSTYIPVGQIHSLENPGIIPLELIEVQSGPYLGEDDIIRYE